MRTHAQRRRQRKEDRCDQITEMEATEEEREDWRGETQVKKMTTKEDRDPRRWRRISSDKEDDNKDATTQGGLNLPEPRDRGDTKEGGNSSYEGENEVRRQYQTTETTIRR